MVATWERYAANDGRSGGGITVCQSGELQKTFPIVHEYFSQIRNSRTLATWLSLRAGRAKLQEMEDQNAPPGITNKLFEQWKAQRPDFVIGELWHPSRIRRHKGMASTSELGWHTWLRSSLSFACVFRRQALGAFGPGLSLIWG